jgi:hypothetical protein
VSEALTAQLRAFQEGRISQKHTKTALQKILVDVEPKLVEEFVSLHLNTCYSPWSALPQESLSWLRQPEIEAHTQDLEQGLAWPPQELQRKGSSDSSSSEGRRFSLFSCKSGSKAAKNRSRAIQKGIRSPIEWQAIARRLVPEGSASYATWFTLGNTALILAVFAYMAGDYIMWLKETRADIAPSDAELGDPDVTVCPSRCAPCM